MLRKYIRDGSAVSWPALKRAVGCAMQDAVEKDDWGTLTYLVQRYASEIISRTNDLPQLVDLLMSLDQATRDAHPELLPYLEWIGATPISDDLPAIDIDALSAGGERSMLAIRALMASITARRLQDRLDQALELVVTAHPHVLRAATYIGSPAETVACGYFTQAGNTLLLATDIVRAEANFLLAWRWRHVDTLGFVAHEVAGKIAALCASTGRLDDAEHWLGRARDLPVPIIDRFRDVATFALPLTRFLLDTERLRLKRAEILLPQLAQPTHGFEFHAWILWATVHWLLLSGRWEEALRRIEEPPIPPNAQQHRAFEHLRISALLAGGRVDEANSRLEDSGDDHPAHLLRGRAAAMRADYSTALRHLDRFPASASGRTALEVQVLRAASLLALNRQAEARATFGALLSALEGNLAIFATIDSFLLDRLFSLCRDLPLAHPTQHAWKARKIRSIYRFQPVIDMPKQVVLTQRELVMLRHLANGTSRTEIARLEFVSVNTVKSQIAAIFRKLSCSTAEDAVQQARSLGLL